MERPMEITAVKGDSTYEVEKAGRITLIHIDDLRAAVPQGADLRRGPPPVDDDDSQVPPVPQPGPSQDVTDVPPVPLVLEDAVPDPKAAGYRLPGSLPAITHSKGPTRMPLAEASQDADPASPRPSRGISPGCQQPPPAIPDVVPVPISLHSSREEVPGCQQQPPVIPDEIPVPASPHSSREEVPGCQQPPPVNPDAAPGSRQPPPRPAGPVPAPRRRRPARIIVM